MTEHVEGRLLFARETRPLPGTSAVPMSSLPRSVQHEGGGSTAQINDKYLYINTFTNMNCSWRQMKTVTGLVRNVLKCLTKIIFMPINHSLCWRSRDATMFHSSPVCPFYV